MKKETTDSSLRNESSIKITSGLKQFLNKEVFYSEMPYTEGDFIVCIEKNNINYGTAVKNNTIFGDFKAWKKITGIKEINPKAIMVYKVSYILNDVDEYFNNKSEARDKFNQLIEEYGDGVRLYEAIDNGEADEAPEWDIIDSLDKDDDDDTAIIGSGVEELPNIKIDDAEDLPLAIIEDTEDGDGIAEIGERTPRNLQWAKLICEAVNNYQALRNENEKLKRLIESLTPGGSEFVNDPEYCVQFVKERINSIPKAILPFKKEATALRDSNAELLSALQKLYHQHQLWVEVEEHWDEYDDEAAEKAWEAIDKAKSIN